ncbi:MAG TPA: hypothetical protein VFP42_05890 [Acidimicrobiia bacterium]|nr:hypothetical protein [Acidimicrobiia bacterium]
MEPERDEVYERIPWETLERQGGDRQWLVYAVCGALVLGVLAYSFVLNRPVAQPVPDSQPVVSSVPATSPLPAAAAPPSTTASPVVVAEADLYAVDPERIIQSAATHAEWVAVEYVSSDGGEENTLAALLPIGVPLPVTPDGVQVYVDWTGIRSVSQTGPSTFEVEVLVSSLVARDGGGFVRQPALLVAVPVEVDPDGGVRASSVPSVSEVSMPPPVDLGLLEVPPEVASALPEGGEVVGGRQTSDGWEVVMMLTGEDGVTRPVAVEVSG